MPYHSTRSRHVLPLRRWLAALAAVAVSAPAAAATAEVVFERAAPSIVVVERLDTSGRRDRFASGVVIGANRVVTACHAVAHTAAVQIRRGEAHFPAVLEYADAERDLCQLAVEKLAAPAVKIANILELKVGQRVYAIGTPKGLELTLSEGLISSLRPRAHSFVIQTSAAMSRGSSGGGLFDEEARLVGVAAFQFAKGQNLNFAVPASWAKEIASRARENWTRAGFKETADRPLGAQLLAMMDLGNWEEALRMAREWTRREPTDALPRHAMGRAYLGLGRSEDAVAALRSALKIRPDFTRGWLDLGTAEAAAGEPGLALTAFTEAVQRDEKLAGAWRGRGIALTSLQRYPEAVEDLRRAVTLNTGNDEAWQALAAAHVAEGRLDLAAAACRKALKLNPESALLWYEFGAVHQQQGDTVQAAQAYEEALRLQPAYVQAVYDLGAVYHAQGDQARTHTMYEKLRTLDAQRAKEYAGRFLAY